MKQSPADLRFDPFALAFSVVFFACAGLAYVYRAEIAAWW